ncbi:MAG: hypothetical protein E6J15_10070 [Chloroflexi bacterium]|nr:MAG: hypothetical protein E6J15_10070 [Chloroflexota bacterium]
MRENAIVVPLSALRRIFVGLVILIVLIVLILIVRTQLFRAGIATLFAPSAAELIDRNAYQALFLSGGQVFFGKLQEQGDHYFVLSDVFYLSVPDQSGGQQQLVKRGTELHGPKDPMIVPVDQVLFIENLRDDGQIATAIRQFKAGQLPAATAPPVTGAPATAAPPVTGAPATAAPSTARPSPTR